MSGAKGGVLREGPFASGWCACPEVHILLFPLPRLGLFFLTSCYYYYYGGGDAGLVSACPVRGGG